MNQMKLRSDLPIKYYLNLHSHKDLQDDLAVLFDISQYLLRVIEIKGKKLDPQNMKFSSKTFKQDLVKKIKALISQQLLEVKGEEIHFTQKGLLTFYTFE
jgi:hypothetical protein